MANNFLPFCGTDTGTNLPTQGAYAVDPNRDIGNSPGVASSKLNNKPLRQATFVASQLAQFVADKTGADTLDDGNTTRFLQQIKAAMLTLAPNITRFTSSSGNWNMAYQFFIVAGSATAGATYTNNGVTYTVVTTIASGTILKATGNGDPTASGTLTKSGGTGDATLTFYAVRKPLYLRVRMAGGGGGGGGGTGSGAGTNGGAGGNSTFGSSLLTANGAGAMPNPYQQGTGGTVTVNSPAIDMASAIGSDGTGGGGNAGGGCGGCSPFGGQGGGGYQAVNGGTSAKANTGSGGGGGGGASTANAGGGGGSGGYIDAMIPSPSSTYAYAVGAAGSPGAGGSGGGAAGGSGAAGVIVVEEHYQ